MNSFVTKIDLSLASKLKADLIDQGFEITTPPYTLFSARKNKISCTLYSSGKLTVQGKDKDEFITYYLEPEIMQAPTYTYPEIGASLSQRIGVDEAGKGDFFGPLCIAGIEAGEDTIKKLLLMGVMDSKKFSDKPLFSLAHQIQSFCMHSIVRIFPFKYNALYKTFPNLNHLLAWGHATVIAELTQKTGCKEVLIDQFTEKPLVQEALKKKSVDVHFQQRPRAEEDPVVAAASILARVAFLEGIAYLEKKFHIQLPKGASGKVVEIGKHLLREHGEILLAQVAKLHFKTYKDILSDSY